MAEQVVQNEQMTYVDFKKVRVNPNITLSIVESGKTVESIKRREKVMHIITTEQQTPHIPAPDSGLFQGREQKAPSKWHQLKESSS